MIMNSVEMPYSKVTGVRFPGGQLTYNELAATIILDENLSSYYSEIIEIFLEFHYQFLFQDY